MFSLPSPNLKEKKIIVFFFFLKSITKCFIKISDCFLKYIDPNIYYICFNVVQWIKIKSRGFDPFAVKSIFASDF